jgi:hypothetical protein
MYWVKIRLDNGSEVHYTESSILRAAARVEDYREHMVFCDIQLIKEEGEDGGGKVDQDSN